MHLGRELKRVSCATRLKEFLTGNSEKWITWWYCGIYKNQRAGSQPNVLVGFRELSDDGSLSDDLIFRRVPLTSLGQMRVGTVWRNGECLQETLYDTQIFDVNFDQGNWQVTSFQYAAHSDLPPPYPFALYPLKIKKDRNWLLEFRLRSGGKLVVPCLEFFSRCYGRSQELKRVLTTYAWNGIDGGVENRLYAPLDQPEENGKWKVKLRKRMVNGDAIFLAHAKYDRYTETQAKQVYAQIEANYDPNGKVPAFVKIEPWFRGDAQLKVKGIWFDEGKSFLALQITGGSDPRGVLIERNRENSNKAELPADNQESGQAWLGAPERNLVKPPEIIDLTDELEPDHGVSPIEIHDPDFEVLGQPRAVIDYKNKKAQDSAGDKGIGVYSTTFSTGEPYGGGKGIGYAAIHARPVMESQGTLRDMWNALLYYKDNSPKSITAVEWFTFEDGYKYSEEPKIIGIPEFTEQELLDPLHTLTTAIKNWPYMDSTTKTEVRGVLVARLHINNEYVHILEIQRRPRKKKDADGQVRDSEESFKGFIFKIKNQNEIEVYLRDFLSDVRHVKGIVQHLVNRCPGRAATFNHSVANDDRFPCESSVLNALAKMDMIL
ncbi:hypothetical protein KY019_002687 [Vibrio cholerae]|nr:hypothetical protein [Vibrio cholerae]EHU0384306.1 hypothetical protein [Vibrio cholerae]EJL6669261.1 hypothetical protein [Vibrio cholerae]EKF9153881.1 hypothetical protein [Vibrio cholerae]